MPTAIQCLTEVRESHILVRIVGALDVASAPAVHKCLMKCLAEQPPVLVVDLCGMRLGDRRALSVFLAVGREAARWPAVPIVLCGPPPETADLLRARSITKYMLVLPTVAAAERSLDRRPAPSIADDLLPVLGASRRAREMVTEACLRWDLREPVGPACTVVTELVNNVVAHAHTMMRLRVSLRGGYLHIAVRDGSTGLPVLNDPTEEATSGRGLPLVAAMSRSWGSLPIDGGKVVWAVLDAGPGAVRRAEADQRHAAGPTPALEA